MRQPLKRRAGGAGAIRTFSLAALMCACAPHLTEGFRSAKSSGDRAYSAGRYDEAANAYRKAGQEAGRARDRAEALYLEAFSHHRARDWDRARPVYEQLIAELPTSELARRASFNLADLTVDAGHAEAGYELYRQLMLKFPNEALARRALERYLSHLERNGGDAPGWLRGVLPQLAPTELDETARYRMAGYLEAASDLQGARDLYLDCAVRHPYPKGGLFDDALWHAAELDEKLNRPQQAISHLERMLATREGSSLMGSYERPRFSPARFRIAVLLRDALRDPAAARREFHRLYADHPTSTLRDDALWEEAKLARETGDAAGACQLAGMLAKDFPGSRYAPCAQALCPSAPAPKGRCHGYLVRSPADASSRATAPETTTEGD